MSSETTKSSLQTLLQLSHLLLVRQIRLGRHTRARRRHTPRFHRILIVIELPLAALSLGNLALHVVAIWVVAIWVVVVFDGGRSAVDAL